MIQIESQNEDQENLRWNKINKPFFKIKIKQKGAEKSKMKVCNKKYYTGFAIKYQEAER